MKTIAVIVLHPESKNKTPTHVDNFANFVLSLAVKTRNSSGDEIANVNFLYDDIVQAVKIQ